MSRFFYNFADSDGQPTPLGFSPLWGTDQSWPCAADAASTSGGVLCNKDEGGLRKRVVTAPDDFTFDFQVDPSLTFEMRARIYLQSLSAGTYPLGFVWRAANSGSATNDTSDMQGLRLVFRDNSGFFRLYGGFENFGTRDEDEIFFEFGQTFQWRQKPLLLRIRQINDQVQVKCWREGEDTEPTTWLVWTPTTPYLPGTKIGIFQDAQTSNPAWVDYFSAGTDNQAAPTEPVPTEVLSALSTTDRTGQVAPNGGRFDFSYTSLTDYRVALEARGVDLQTRDVLETLWCYPDWPSGHTGVFVSSATWVTDATRFCQMIGVSPFTGVFVGGFFISPSVETSAIQPNQSYFKVIGIGVDNTINGSGARAFTSNSVFTNQLIDRCLFRSYNGITIFEPGEYIDIRNSFIIHTLLTREAIRLRNNSTPNFFLRNNTVVGGANSITSFGADSWGTFENNIVYGYGVASFSGGTANLVGSSNIANDGFPVGDLGVTTLSDADFIDAPNDDYHLASGALPQFVGADLGAFFSTDFDGDSRPQGARWDVGADERPTVGQDSTLITISSYYVKNNSYWRVKSFPAFVSAGNPDYPTARGIATAMSPDGAYCCIGGGSPIFVMYNTSDWSVVTPAFPWPAAGANAVKFSPDGKYLAIATNSNPYLWVYDVATWTRVTLGHTPPGSYGFSVDWTTDSAFLAYAHNNNNPPGHYVIDVSDWSQIGGFDAPSTGAQSSLTIVISKEANMMATCYGGAPFVTAFDLTTKLRIWEYSGTALSFNGNGRTLMAVNPEGTILAIGSQLSPFLVLLDPLTGALYSGGPSGGDLPTHRSIPCNFSKDGKYLFLGQWATPARFTYWDVATWTKTVFSDAQTDIGDAVMDIDTDGSFEPPAVAGGPKAMVGIDL